METSRNNIKYFNFPIHLMQGILKSNQEGKKDFLSNLLYYSLYGHSIFIEDLNQYEETEEERFKRSASWLNVKLANVDYALSRGKQLHSKYRNSKVYTGLNTDIFWDFYKNDKTDYIWECLFTFLALKSIIGKKQYAKTNNQMMFTRMAGKEKVKDYLALKGFDFTRYHLDKIKTELQINWGLKYYSRYTKGFYVGFDIDLKELVFEAEKRKESMKINLLKESKKSALNIALEKIKVSTTLQQLKK
ncbi:hypothetical protein ATE47_12265 [Chryseobacterium sp. IHB B 17019]|uniref:hypothetical protein n=1 Tax=Chryseobacterium sp. IHB B 17019 TaxID=1721091 RepID=UPI00072288AA|nr:hypothetical protein [Chryseobacterium sp. IHB B 17019]ALR31246.1 hypothetical protein ATE47_12265 [Chryseobacterium sp. IHB B 17019]